MIQKSHALQSLEIPPSLEHIVKNAWVLEFDPLKKTKPISILPDGTLHFFFFNPIKITISTPEEIIKCQSSFVRGLSKSYYSIKSRDTGKVLLLKVYPWVGLSLLGISMKQLANRQISLYPNNNSTIFQKDWVIKNPKKPFHFFRKQANSSCSLANEIIKRAYFRIMEKGGNISLSQMSKNNCVSESWMRKRFYQDIGISPKGLAKIGRVIFAISNYQNGFSGNLTDLSLSVGLL